MEKHPSSGASTELFKLISDDSYYLEPSLGADSLQPLTAFESHAAPLTPSQDFSRLRLQPAFEPSADNRYHLNDLLKYHDRDFIWNAYRAILKREPDETGLRVTSSKDCGAALATRSTFWRQSCVLRPKVNERT